MDQRPWVTTLLVRCFAAVAAVGAAHLIREAASFATGPGLPPFITFYPAILIIAFFAGLVPGLLATTAAAFVSAAWIFPTGGNLALLRPVEVVSLALFVLMGAGASVVSEFYHAALRREERYRAALSAQESEARARSIVDGAPDTIFIQTEGRLAYVNPAACRLFGAASPEELVGTPVLAHVHPDYRAAAASRIARLNERREAVTDLLELPFLRVDGSEVWVETTGRPVVHEGKNGALVFVRDVTARREAERQRRESDQRFRGTLESMLEGFQLIGKDWRYLYLNPAAEGHARRPGSELIGQRMMDAWPGIEGTEMFAVLHRCMEERSAQAMENEFAYPDGSRGWFDLRVSPVAEGIAVFSADITERKRYEQALRASEEKFSQAFASSPIAIALSRADDGFVLDVNERWVDLLGYSREEILGHYSRDMGIWPRQDTARFVTELKEKGMVRGWEQEFIRKDGTTFTGEVSARLIDMGAQKALLSNILDITERKRSQRALAESQALLQAVMDLVPHFIFAKDRESRHLFVNKACAAASGLLPEQMVGRRDVEVLADMTEAGKFMADDHDVIVGQRPKVDIEERLTDRKGHTRILSTTKIPFFPPGSSEPGLLGVSVDITELKRVEEEVHQLNANLERRVQERTAELAAANKELESFAYAVSHDLRAPLRALAGFSQALREDYAEKLDGGAAGYLDQITSAAERMGELIDGILQLSRITRGELRWERVDLTAIAEQVMNDLAREEPGRHVQGEIQPGLRAWGDARLLRAVLENLLGNAWKYTSHVERPEIRMYEKSLNGHRTFCVADNGAGFSMEHQARLFQPFQRLHRQDEFPGIGIGLATVSRIIGRHGGTISATGSPGKGAEFTFSLPADEPLPTGGEPS
ncbi:MAG TPA: PAS domain S-box protein [Spirochaetia bacterium]|nr:PAS domain S-box protein [Spirochaetia bacterium]